VLPFTSTVTALSATGPGVVTVEVVKADDNTRVRYSVVAAPSKLEAIETDSL
jgi:hypothetical protein